MEEEWRKVAICPRYKVSNFGRILGPSGTFLRPNKQRRVFLYDYEQKKYTVLVATIVATAFVEGRTKDKVYVRHMDGNYDNNAASNLEWSTNPHAYKVEVFKDGALIKTFPSTYHAARKYKVSASLISYACHRNRTIEKLPGIYFRYAPQEEN